MKKRFWILTAFAVLILAAALIVFLPRRVPEGFYSAKNENRVVFAFGMEAVGFSFSSDGSGFVSLRQGQASVDVVSFASHSVGFGTVTFSGLSASSGADPGESLSFDFASEGKNIIIDSCHYDRAGSWQ